MKSVPCWPWSLRHMKPPSNADLWDLEDSPIEEMQEPVFGGECRLCRRAVAVPISTKAQPHACVYCLVAIYENMKEKCMSDGRGK